MNKDQGQVIEAQETQLAVADQSSAALPALPQTDKNDPAYLMQQFTEGNALFFSTLHADGSRETAIKIYNSISDTVPLRDHINVPLSIVHYMAHPVELADEKTGELFTGVRVILIDEDGTNYAAVSEGVRGSITRLVSIVGQAPWEPALRMKAIEKNTRNAMFRVMTLQLLPMEVGEEPPKKGKK